MSGPAARAAPASVARERLLTSLTASARPIIVISGAAGSGKSTLAAQFLDRDGTAQATVRVTPTLDDPALLAVAIARGLDSSGRAARAITASATASEPAFSSIILPAVSQLLPSRHRSINLLIDDVHLLSKPKCRAILERIAATVPQGSRLLLVTREDAPDWLARPRAEGLVYDVPPGDLAFDTEEARALFEGMHVSVGEREIEQIVADSEGWAVGLYLIALARQGERTAVPSEPVPGERQSERYLLDYVRSQVLSEFDAAHRAFLLDTSILEELRPSLCEAVTQDPSAPEILADLQARLQLVVPSDDSSPARYHHLLGQALRAELARVHPSLVPRLHERAARWYEREGQTDAAIAHAKAADALALAGSLMWSRLIECVASGRPDRLSSWLEGLSPDRIAQDRWLSMAAAWLAMQTADQEGIHRWTLHCEVLAGPSWRGRATGDEYAAALAVLRALIGDEGPAAMSELAESAYRGLPSDNGFRGPAAFLWGVGLTLQGDFVRGDETLRTAELLGRSLDAPVSIADSLSWRGLLAIYRGEAQEGIRLISEARDVMDDYQLHRLATSVHAISAQALMLALRGDKRSARTTLGTARRMMTITESVGPWFAVCGRLIQARAAVLLGDGAMARTLLGEARVLMTPDLEGTLVSTLMSAAADSLDTVTSDGISAGSLTAAELRVLQFLPSHLTFPKIGEHLFLSTNTVKTHALSIYRKLGVTSRAEAVERARGLGLVEAPLVG